MSPFKLERAIGRLAWAWSPPNYERIELTSNLVTGSLMAPNLQPSRGLVQKMVLAVENFFGSGPTPSSSPAMQAYGATDAALESFGGTSWRLRSAQGRLSRDGVSAHSQCDRPRLQ